MKLDASDITDLAPLIREAVRAALVEIASDDAKLGGGRLAFPEAEAAALIGVQRFRLRDARLRGEVKGKRVGKVIVYERGELLRYLTDSI